MTSRGFALTLGAAALLMSALSCVPHRPGAQDQRAFGVYKCAIVGPGGALPQFRMLLFAEMPDRLHVEVIGPMGAPRLILDTGGGSMCVTLVAEKVAYTGSADPLVLSRFLGVPVRIDLLVDAILNGSTHDAELSFTRRPERRAGLPESLDLRGEGRSIKIVRMSERSVRAGATLGNGAPPAGVEVRPLDSLASDARVAWPGDGGEAP